MLKLVKSLLVVFVAQVVKLTLPLLEQMGSLLGNSLAHLCLVTRVDLEGASNFALFNVLDRDRQSVKEFQHKLDNLNGRVAVVGVKQKPLLEDRAARVVKEHLLIRLVLKELASLREQFESAHGTAAFFICLPVQIIRCVHLSDKLFTLRQAELLKVLQVRAPLVLHVSGVCCGVTHTSNNLELPLLVGHPLLLTSLLLLQEVLQQWVHAFGLLAERGKSRLAN